MMNLLLLAASLAAAEAPVFTLSLKDAEAAAAAHSHALAAALQDAVAAEETSRADMGALLPRLTLDGSYRYQTEVPDVAFVPGRPAQPFGSHRATTVGPSLSWTLWDQGLLWRLWRAQAARSRSSEAAAAAARRQVILGARLAYFQTQLALERARLLAEGVGVEDAQYEDIARRQRAGTTSRIDLLSAHQEALTRRRDLRQAQGDLAAAMRELSRLTGLGGELDLSAPLHASTAAAPHDWPAASARLALDAPASDLSALLPAAERPLDEAHPALAALSEQAAAARETGKAARAGLWPSLRLSARSSYDYPNGPVLEYTWQHAVGLSASVPLFEGGRARKQAKAMEAAAGAAEARRAETADALRRDWLAARDQLAALRDQQKLDALSVSETGELARLVYASYQAGRSSHLEVQSANLRALEAKARAARTDAQTLIQLAIIDSLSRKP